jgi:hypothetical protein
MHRALVPGLLLLISCTTYQSELERIRTGLVGMPARQLSHCMPVPSEVQQEGDVEVVIYRWNIDDSDSLESVSVGPVDTMAGSTMGEHRRRRDRGDFLISGERPDSVAYCELTFELVEKRVQAVRVEGRERSGLNRDSACLMEARRCVPQPSKPDPVE